MSTAEKKDSVAEVATTTAPAEKSLIDRALEETVKQDVAPARAEDLLRGVIQEVMKGTVTWDKNITRSVTKGIAAIDAAISKQLAAIMHAPAFQKLEGTWRGLHHLVDKTETSTTLKLKVLNVNKRELFKDLDTAVEFDQSQIFRQVYEGEFGVAGGEPFGALIGDYEFSNHPEDISLIEKMSGIAAAGHCPFVTAAAPKLFGLNSYTELSNPRDLAKTFEAKEYAKWRSFRESPDSRFVAMVMPRVLARRPYGEQSITVDEFKYEEFPQHESGISMKVPHDDYCWMNAAYVYGARLTAAFAKTNWCTSIVGKENGGAIEGLETHFFMSDSGDTKMKCPTEIAITDRRDAELGNLGFLPLCWYKNTDYAAFFEAQTVQKPKKYVSPRDSANAEISSRLPYIMASSRIAHYLKMIARDKQGAFMEASDCQDWLERWIAQYVLADEKPSPEMKARFPLAQFKVVVSEIPGKPGAYNANILMRPWLLMKELNAALSMVAEIPKK